MRRGLVAFSALTLIALGVTGCGLFRFEQREPWRAQAEEACVSQRLVQPSAYMSRSSAIDGPGACGISYPFKVSALAGGSVGLSSRGTLACPIIPSIDAWLNEVVQPAASLYFGAAVAEVKSGSYSCRPRNNRSGAKLSEHAFGNALDIAVFTLADGRKIAVKTGWHGAPEEQGFLRDVQGAACDQFNTVLAPGSNRFHYDHIHVDLMRRGSGHKICNPDQIPGDVVAARAAKDRGYALRSEPGVTGALGRDTGRARTASLNGRSVKAKPKSKVRNILSDDDDDWIEDDGPRPSD